MKVNIRNQCLDFKLKDRRCFSNGAHWSIYPDLRIDSGSIMSVGLKSSLLMFEGGIMYKLQRKHVECDDQSELIYTLLFIAWKYEGYKKFCVFIQLIECYKAFHLDKIKLEEYYQRHANQLSTYTRAIKDTWLIHDGTVLMTELDLDFTQRDGRLNIAISEGIRDAHTRRPEWINIEK
jgi:hypothetical protein